MDASSLLDLPTFPATSGLQIFALFINFFFPALALLVVTVRVAGRVAASQLAADDWLICVAMLMSIAETIISFFCTFGPTTSTLTDMTKDTDASPQSSRQTSSASLRSRCHLMILHRL